MARNQPKTPATVTVQPREVFGVDVHQVHCTEHGPTFRSQSKTEAEQARDYHENANHS